MLGAIAGDMIGSPWEFRRVTDDDFPLFQAGSTYTDDTVLTVAIADALLGDRDYGAALRRWGNRFAAWLAAPSPRPYGSYGNGSAMRVAPVGFACTSLAQVLDEAAAAARVTHDHPEGIKGAQAIAGAVFLARTGNSKERIRAWVTQAFGYDLARSWAGIRAHYGFDESCQGSVPEALVSFLESHSWTGAVRRAVLLGGDSDTLACMAGAVAQAFYGKIPASVIRRVRQLLPAPLAAVLDSFEKAYPQARPMRDTG